MKHGGRGSAMTTSSRSLTRSITNRYRLASGTDILCGLRGPAISQRKKRRQLCRKPLRCTCQHPLIARNRPEEDIDETKDQSIVFSAYYAASCSVCGICGKLCKTGRL